MKEAEADAAEARRVPAVLLRLPQGGWRLLPYRIARGLGAKTTEEWDVTSYKVNPTFKADRFKVGS